MSFSDNSWWVLEGFNAKNGAADGVIRLTNGSNHNVLRRFVAWDAHIDKNNAVISHYANSSYNTYEDCAVFGAAPEDRRGGTGIDRQHVSSLLVPLGRVNASAVRLA